MCGMMTWTVIDARLQFAERALLSHGRFDFVQIGAAFRSVADGIVVAGDVGALLVMQCDGWIGV